MKVAELYAIAIAIEREAAERYGELAERMEDSGNGAIAEVFAMLARHETEHLLALQRRCEGVELAALEEHSYRWIEAGAPDAAARELVFRLMTPRDALTIALNAEFRAQAFFERVMMTTPDPALRALAREMAADEAEHVVIIERLLAYTPPPPPLVDWPALTERS